MIAILTGVLMLLAVVSWVVAVNSAVQLVRLSPAGTRLRNYGRIGWWQFAQLRSDLGPSAEAHIRVYQRAFVAFICCVIVAVVIGALVGLQAQN